MAPPDSSRQRRRHRPATAARCIRNFAHTLTLALVLLLANYHGGAYATQLIVLTQPIKSVAGEPFVLQPVVALTDDDGNMLPHVNSGTVRVSIGTNPGQFGTVQPTIHAFRFVNGIATCQGLYINLAAVGYTLVFVSLAHGVRTESTAFDVVVGLRYTIAIVTDISTAWGGTPFRPQPVAAIVDRGGNRVSTLFDGTVRLEIVRNPVGGHLLPASNLNVTIGAGLAKFQNTFIDVAGSPYTLRYTTSLTLPGGSTVETNPFTVTEGECTRMVLRTTPANAFGGTAFARQPVLLLLDAGGNPVSDDSTSRIHAAIASNPSSGVLAPAQSLRVRVIDGVATFRNLRIDRAGADYTLVFTLQLYDADTNTYTETAVEQVSQPFDVVVGPPAVLDLQQLLSDGVLDNQPHDQQPELAVLDAGGNIVTSMSVGDVTATLVSSASVAATIVVDTTAAPLLTVASVRAIATPLIPMPYGVGQRLQIEVLFSDEVRALGVPTLVLATSASGSGPSGVAECVTLNTWSTTLVFEYDVVATDSASDLNYVSTTALQLLNNADTIVDRNLRTPVLTLPDVASVNALAGTSTVGIDTTPPRIVSVSSPAPGSGEFGANEAIDVAVRFSRPITVYGAPLLPIDFTAVGTSTIVAVRHAVFTRGNNTDTLVFVYVVRLGDTITAAAAVLGTSTSVQLNGGFLKHSSTRPTTNAIATMPAASMTLAGLNTIVIDIAAPVVDPAVGVTAASSTTPNGLYAPGDTIEVVVTFTKPVRVTGLPRLYLDTGATIKRPAQYKAGDGTNALVFKYTVAPFDSHSASSSNNAHLNYRDDDALELNGGSITRFLHSSTGGSARGVDAVLTLAAVTAAGTSLQSTARIDLDGNAPIVLAIAIVGTSPAAVNNVVQRDNTISIEISFSARVVVDTTHGKPSLQLDVGVYDRHAVYVSGSGSAALLFAYEVKLGDTAPAGLDYRSRTSLLLNRATIRRAALTPTLDALLLLATPTQRLATPPLVVDPTAGVVTTIVSLVADVVAGAYGSGHVITLTLSFSDEVAVDGVPTLELNTHARVPYVSGSATRKLMFVYIVKDTDVAIASLNKRTDAALVCNAPCRMINYNGLDVAVTLAGIDVTPAAIAISTLPPVVVRVYAITPASTINNNVFVVGDAIEIVVEMSLDVFIEPPPSAYPDKAPLLMLNSVALPLGRSVLCQGYYQNNRKLLLFRYIVQAGDSTIDLTYVDEDALTLNSYQSAIKRFATTPRTDALLTLPRPPPPLSTIPNQKLTVDTRAVPRVVSVSALNANGLYRCGDVLELVVTMSQHVVVIGSPVLWLDLGVAGRDRKAVYARGSGSTTLVFAYAIQDGDYSMDVEYVDHHSLDVSATANTAILHRATHPTTPATLDLPFPFTQNSLGFLKDIIVNGRKPIVVSTTFLSPDGVYAVGQKIVIEVTFSACIVVDVGGSATKRVTLRFEPSGATPIVRHAVYVSASSPGPKLRFEYVIQTGDTARDLDYAASTALELHGGARILACPTDALATPVQPADVHLNPPGGRILGATTRSIVFGRTRFTDLVIDRLGLDYRVEYTTQLAGNAAVLTTASRVNVLFSACYGVRSTPFASNDRLGVSVAIDDGTLVLGGPGAQQPIAAVQTVAVVGDATTYVDEIQTIETIATQRPAIQELTTSAAPGETLGGWFFLQIGIIGPTRRLYYNFDAAQLRVALELDLGFGLDTIRVTRDPNTFCACTNGFVWRITFLYVEGPLAPLTTIHELTGRLAQIGMTSGRVSQARVIVDATAIGGFFTLQHANAVTRDIAYNVDEAELATILTQYLGLAIRSVARHVPNKMHETTWSITFIASDALYDVPQLTAQTAGLLGYGARLVVRTLRDGLGRLSGAFRLRFRNDLFPTDETTDIAVTATETQVETALEALVSIQDVRVTRSAAMNAAGGYAWTITFVKVNTRNAYGPIDDTSAGHLPALVAVTATSVGNANTQTRLLYGTNARVVVRAGGYDLPPVPTGDTHWGLPGDNAGIVAVFTHNVDAHVWKQQSTTLTADDTRSGDLFGASVSVKRDTMLIGAPAAAVFGDAELQHLLCDADGGYFRLLCRGKASSALAFSADHTALHAAIVDVMGGGVAASDVRVLTAFTGGVCSNTEIAIALRTPDHADASGNVVDLRVDASGLTKGGVAGAGTAHMQEYRAGTFRRDGIGAKGLQCGAAYIFRRVNSVWTQATKLTPPASELLDVYDFGVSVAVHDTIAVVAAPGAFHERGRVYVYEFNAGNSGAWRLFQTLSAAPYDASVGDRFGDAVAISGDPLASGGGALTIVVGAPGYATSSGAVFVFDLLNGAFTNRQQLLLPTSELRQGDRFGSAVALDMVTTFTLVIGAERSNDDSGLVVVMTRQSAIDTFFTVQQVLVGSDTRLRDRFGTSVGVSRDTLIVGAHERFDGRQTIRKPVQSITTSTLDGSALRDGTFMLSINWINSATPLLSSSPVPNTVRRNATRPIAFDMDANALVAVLEHDLQLGPVLVRRVGPSVSGSRGFTWYVTFAGATSDLLLLDVDDAMLRRSNPQAVVTVDWVVHVAPVLRSNAFVFTRSRRTGVWTEQATLFPRAKQYFSWFGSAVAIDERYAVVGAPNLDTFVAGSNAGGGFVFDLGFLALQFSAKTYNVLEGSDVEITVERCRSSDCAMDVASAPALYINYDTGDAFSDQQSNNFVPAKRAIGPYKRLAMLEAVPFSRHAFFARDVLGQEPFPQVPRGRWLKHNMVGTAMGRQQFYGSTERRSRWLDAAFDYAGVCDYVPSVGEFFFDVNVARQTFTVSTTDDAVVEDPDETVMLRLSLPGVWPSIDGSLWATLTIRDNGDGGTGTRTSLALLSANANVQPDSLFSEAVAICDDVNVAIVGAPRETQALVSQNKPVACGAAYVYARRSGVWELETKLAPSASECVDRMRFGASVALDASLGTVCAVVGAPGAATASIYRRTAAGAWVQDAQLTELTPSGAAMTRAHKYGDTNAVGVFGDVVVVGASGLESVFVYHRLIATGWTRVAQLRCSDRQVTRLLEDVVEQTNAFGVAVALHRRTLVVGAPLAAAATDQAFDATSYYDRRFDRAFFSTGAAFVFHLRAQVQTIELRFDDPVTVGSFVLALTLRGVSGTTSALSFRATARDVQLALQTLSVLRIVEVTRTGTSDRSPLTWRVTFIDAIVDVPLLIAQWKGFGCDNCVRFSSPFAIDPAHQILVTQTVGLGTWQQHARLATPDANAGDAFGASVAISGEQVLVGAPQSSALTTTTWNFETGDLTGWRTTGTAFDHQPTFGDNAYARLPFYSFKAHTSRTRTEKTGQRALHEGRYYVGTFEARPGAGKQPLGQIPTCAFANDATCRAVDYKLPRASTPAGSFQGDSPVGTMTSQTFTIPPISVVADQMAASDGPWLSFKVGGGCDSRFTYVELLVDGVPIVPTYKATGRCDEAMRTVRWDLLRFAGRSAQLRVVDASTGVVWGHINVDDVRFSWDVAQTSTPLAGAAYTFRRTAPASLDPCVDIDRQLCRWAFETRLQASDKRSSDAFGFAVAVDDASGVAVVSAPGAKRVDATNTIVLDRLVGPLEDVGAVYVFQRIPAVRDGKGVLLTPPQWRALEAAKLQYPHDPTQPTAHTRFGAAVALDRTALLVGAPFLSTATFIHNSGQAFYYDVGVASVRFTAPTFACVEGNADGVAILTLTRSLVSVHKPLTVAYATEDRSALSIDARKYSECMVTALPQRYGIQCLDYQQSAGDVTFAAQEAFAQLRVPIVDDLCYERHDKSFVVRLHVPGGEALVGEAFVATVQIDDDDFAFMYDVCV